jgi:hypothetical protein
MGDRSTARVYRNLLLLYPRDFRDRYGDDLVQALTDLSGELGPHRAWRRAALDLVVTVPRYRMETLMKEEHRSTFLTFAIMLMACAGIVFPLVTGGSWGLLVSVLLWATAAFVAITQRSKLARSMDAVNGTRLRRTRLTTAAVLALLLPVMYVTIPYLLGDHWGVDAIVAFSLWFVVLIAAVSYFIAGITTPKARVISR